MKMKKEQSRRDGRYKGVRMRKWGRWVAEVRQPNSRDRIWLGSYHTAEQAARAYDAAVYCLRGPAAVLHFPADPPDILSAEELSPSQIQVAASKHARRSAGGARDQLNRPVVEKLFFTEPAESGGSSFGDFEVGEGFLTAEERVRGGDDGSSGGVYFDASRMWNF